MQMNDAGKPWINHFYRHTLKHYYRNNLWCKDTKFNFCKYLNIIRIYKLAPSHLTKGGWPFQKRIWYVNNSHSGIWIHKQNWPKHVARVTLPTTNLDPWSSGYGWRLRFERSCVQIPAPYTGSLFFTLIYSKNCIVFLKRPKKTKKRPKMAHF